MDAAMRVLLGGLLWTVIAPVGAAGLFLAVGHRYGARGAAVLDVSVSGVRPWCEPGVSAGAAGLSAAGARYSPAARFFFAAIAAGRPAPSPKGASLSGSMIERLRPAFLAA